MEVEKVIASSAPALKLPRSLTSEAGQSGTMIYNGLITGEDYNRQLTGKLAIRQYEIMRRSDATAYQALMACVLPLLDAKWDTEPASEDEKDQYAARLVKHNLFDYKINWSDHVREGLNMLSFGFSIAEKTYGAGEFEGNFQIMLDKLSFRKQISIQKWETKEGQPGVTQQLIDKQVSIPDYKLVVYTNEKEGDNDEGISRLRRCYKDWDMKDKLGLVYAAGLEKAAIPVPIVKYPSGTGEAEKNAAIESIRQYRSNESSYMMVPVGWEIEKFDIASDGPKQILEALGYFDRQMLRVALAQFLEIGSKGSSGSFSASNNQNSLYLKALKSVAETMRYTAQFGIIKQLCDLNFSDLPNGYPKLRVSKLNDDDLQVVADAVQKLSGASALTITFETEQALRGILGIPPLPDDYEKDYEQKREAAKKALENPPDPNGNGDPIKPKPSQNKDPKAEAVRAARVTNQRLIDVILR